MSALELVHVGVESGVSSTTGRPFCRVTASIGTPEGGREAFGQLEPAEVRRMALDWLATAEAAESDAALVATLRDEVGIPDAVIGHLLAGVRDRRAGR